MDNLFDKILHGDRINPPDICSEAFNITFPEVKNVEWHKRPTDYEAVFYKDSIEYIANFDQAGKLLKYKMNISPTLLPEAIRQQFPAPFELMNAILINEGNDIKYELIVRKIHERSLFLLDVLGKVIEQKLL